MNGSSILSPPFALAFHNSGSLFAGSNFIQAGDKASANLAQWTAAVAQCGLTTGGPFTFYGGNLPLSVQITSLGSLDCISVQRFNRNHPNATSVLNTGYYWEFRGTNSSGADVSDFSLELTLPTTFSADDGDQVCRYTGAAWDCSRTSNSANSVTRAGISQFSPWAVSNEAPTAVTLAGFEASIPVEGILLTWETALEIDVLGFNLYRAESEEGERLQINSELIPAQAMGGIGGAAYTFHDPSAQPGTLYFYWLEIVQIEGNEWAGPIEAQAAAHQVFLPSINR